MSKMVFLLSFISTFKSLCLHILLTYMILHLSQTFIFCRMLKWMTLMTLGSTCILFLRRPFLERTLMLTRIYALEVIREMMLLQGILVFVELLIMQDCCSWVKLMVNSWIIPPTPPTKKFHNWFLCVFRCLKPSTEGCQRHEESDLSEAIPRGM